MALVVFLQEDEYVPSVYRHLKLSLIHLKRSKYQKWLPFIIAYFKNAQSGKNITGICSPYQSESLFNSPLSILSTMMTNVAADLVGFVL